MDIFKDNQEKIVAISKKIEQEQMLSEALNQVGLPDITNFTEMKLLKRIFEIIRTLRCKVRILML